MSKSTAIPVRFDEQTVAMITAIHTSTSIPRSTIISHFATFALSPKNRPRFIQYLIPDQKALTKILDSTKNGTPNT